MSRNVGETSPSAADCTPTNRPKNWVEKRRAKLPEGSRRRRLYDRLALQVDEPTDFLQGKAELVAQLMPKSGDATAVAARAADLLSEAQASYAQAEERAASATTRATTLQGAVAIAASLLLAGAGLLLDHAKLHGSGWRIAFAVLLFAVTLSLVMSGLRALSATSTIHVWHRPTATDIVARAAHSETQGRVERAADMLLAYSFNTKIAAWKVAYLGAAAWWFRIALGVLVALALALATYAVAGPESPSTGTKPGWMPPQHPPAAPRGEWGTGH